MPNLRRSSRITSGGQAPLVMDKANVCTKRARQSIDDLSEKKSDNIANNERQRNNDFSEAPLLIPSVEEGRPRHRWIPSALCRNSDTSACLLWYHLHLYIHLANTCSCQRFNTSHMPIVLIMWKENKSVHTHVDSELTQVKLITSLDFCKRFA